MNFMPLSQALPFRPAQGPELAEGQRTAPRQSGSARLTRPRGWRVSLMWMGAALLLPALPVTAKRSAPEPVHPIVVGNVEYASPGWPVGFIIATDTRTRREIWRKRIYRVNIDPALERDVQDVFITSMTLSQGNLLITDERGRRYALKLTTRKVSRLP
jgi:hypothetical protein